MPLMQSKLGVPAPLQVMDTAFQHISRIHVMDFRLRGHSQPLSSSQAPTLLSVICCCRCPEHDFLLAQRAPCDNVVQRS